MANYGVNIEHIMNFIWSNMILVNFQSVCFLLNLDQLLELEVLIILFDVIFDRIDESVLCNVLFYPICGRLYRYVVGALQVEIGFSWAYHNGSISRFGE